MMRMRWILGGGRPPALTSHFFFHLGGVCWMSDCKIVCSGQVRWPLPRKNKSSGMGYAMCRWRFSIDAQW